MHFIFARHLCGAQGRRVHKANMTPGGPYSLAGKKSGKYCEENKRWSCLDGG